jgi:hypothetical protein
LFVVQTMYRPWFRGLLLGLAAAAAFTVAGCGGADAPYPVHGTVYLDDQPATELAGGTVTFNSAELHKSASGEIQADGTYRLGSLAKDDGAIPGTYQVTVSPPEVSGAGEREKGRRGAKPASFVEPKDLEVTVERKTNDVPIRLKKSAAGRGAGR